MQLWGQVRCSEGRGALGPAAPSGWGGASPFQAPVAPAPGSRVLLRAMTRCASSGRKAFLMVKGRVQGEGGLVLSENEAETC